MCRPFNEVGETNHFMLSFPTSWKKYGQQCHLFHLYSKASPFAQLRTGLDRASKDRGKLPIGFKGHTQTVKLLL